MSGAHCWKDKREHAEDVYGWGSPEYWATWTDDGDSLNATCMREAGHSGEHEFTPDDKIGVTFAATAERPS